MRAAIYARVSTTEQDPAAQVAAAREYCTRRGWDPAEYVDHGVSGARDRRPELSRLMADARRREVGAVVVYRFDRFARSVAHLARALDEFRALGVEFVSLSEAVDTTTAAGRVLFHVAAAFAEFERDLIRERVRFGMAAARARGAAVGRPRRSVDAAEVHELRRIGVPWPAIAAGFEISPATARRALKRANGAAPGKAFGSRGFRRALRAFQKDQVLTAASR